MSEKAVAAAAAVVLVVVVVVVVVVAVVVVVVVLLLLSSWLSSYTHKTVTSTFHKACVMLLSISSISYSSLIIKSIT